MTKIDPLVARLRAAGCVFAEDEAALLRNASGGDEAALEAHARRRERGEPIEHVVGWVELLGRRYAVAPGVFVPRMRSELLVRCAVERLHATARRDRLVVVDLCCGSGALGAAIVDAAPDLAIELHASDVDSRACACARENVEPRGGVVHEGDLDGALPATLLGRVDVLVANVPYVASADIATLPPEAREHEPRIALDGGTDGLDVLRRVAERAPTWLAPGGAVLFEVAEHQLTTARAALANAGLVPSEFRDEDLEAVVVQGSRTPD